MNESRQTVETDTLWLSNIRALNFRKPGHLRKYCNNETFPIYGITNNNLLPEAIYCFNKLYMLYIAPEVMVGDTCISSLIVINTTINQLETNIF